MPRLIGGHANAPTIMIQRKPRSTSWQPPVRRRGTLNRILELETVHTALVMSEGDPGALPNRSATRTWLSVVPAVLGPLQPGSRTSPCAMNCLDTNCCSGNRGPRLIHFFGEFTMSAAAPFDPFRPFATSLQADRRWAMTAEAAYFYALRRGFEPGHELEDWLAAEAELERAQACGEIVRDPNLRGS